MAWRSYSSRNAPASVRAAARSWASVLTFVDGAAMPECYSVLAIRGRRRCNAGAPMRRLLISVAVLVALTGAAQATARDTAGEEAGPRSNGERPHVSRLPRRPDLAPARRRWSLVVDRWLHGRLAVAGRHLARCGRAPTAHASLRPALDDAVRGSVQWYGRFVDVHPVAWLSKRLLVARFDGSLGQESSGSTRLRARSSGDARSRAARRSWPRRTLADHVVLVVGRMRAKRSGDQLLVVRANGAVRSIGLDRIVVASTEAPAEDTPHTGIGRRCRSRIAPTSSTPMPRSPRSTSTQ